MKIPIGVGFIQGNQIEVNIDFNGINHLLVCGQSRSGKSVLAKLMLFEAMKQGAAVYIIDGKGGIDFGDKYEEHCKLYCEREDILALLKDMCSELRERLSFMRKNKCRNIYEYNIKNPNTPVQPIIVLVDELIDIMDTKGKKKEVKLIIEEITECIETISRLGATPGITLILSTQKPDMDILGSQMKNNCGVRICGKVMDDATSRQVLNSNEAANLPNIKGRFYMTSPDYNGEFQAYLFDENEFEFKSYGFNTFTNFSNCENQIANDKIANNQIANTISTVANTSISTKDKSKRINKSVNIEPDLLDNINAYCAKTGKSMADAINFCLGACVSNNLI